jgi:hypothetical protein
MVYLSCKPNHPTLERKVTMKDKNTVALNNYSETYVKSVQAELNEIWKPEIEAGKRKPFTYEEALAQVRYENAYYNFKAFDSMMKHNGGGGRMHGRRVGTRRR